MGLIRFSKLMGMGFSVTLLWMEQQNVIDVEHGCLRGRLLHVSSLVSVWRSHPAHTEVMPWPMTSGWIDLFSLCDIHRSICYCLFISFERLGFFFSPSKTEYRKVLGFNESQELSALIRQQMKCSWFSRRTNVNLLQLSGPVIQCLQH